MTPEQLRAMQAPIKAKFRENPPAAQTVIAEHVQRGAGLLMIGGWESYHGLGGDWDGTPIGDLLPVTVSTFESDTVLA